MQFSVELTILAEDVIQATLEKYKNSPNTKSVRDAIAYDLITALSAVLNKAQTTTTITIEDRKENLTEDENTLPIMS